MSRLFAGTPFDLPPTCDRCNQIEENCECQPMEEKPVWLDPAKQQAKVRVDRRKHGRCVTVVWGLHPSETDLKDLLSELKTTCGAGGALKDDNIEIQGDHVDRVTNRLKQIGYRIRS
ncbi:MAG: translation initiation factor [Planctomycetota bacterium]|nr:translation initiation factor [Planctomycetota bacterium]